MTNISISYEPLYESSYTYMPVHFQLALCRHGVPLGRGEDSQSAEALSRPQGAAFLAAPAREARGRRPDKLSRR